MRTFYFTALAVVAPLILGTIAALIFHRQFPFRGVLRGIFIMPMMATPVAVALVWTMMFHPQQGVLNYLLSLVGLPPSLWVYSPQWVIPSLVMVEVWHWTPLVMLIVLGGLAALPTEPYESAKLDGASEWQLFRYITLPLVAPFLLVAAVIRTIDALKAFDTIYVITSGGPGTASETINLYLYLQAFAFYNIGNASAVVVIFFFIVMALALLLLYVREADPMDVTAAPATPLRRRSRFRPRRWLRKAGFAFSVAVIVSPAILVFLWMLSLSLKNEIDNITYPPVFIPSPPTFANFVSVFEQNSMFKLFLEQRRRLRRRHADRAAGRHSCRVRHRPDRRAPADGADPDRADDAGAVLPDSAVRRVPVPAPQQHADRAGDHAPGHHGADHRLHHGRAFRDAAARTRGSRADRRRQPWAAFRHVALPLARPGHRRRLHPRVHLFVEQFHLRRRAGGRETRTLPVAVYNVLTFEQLAWGPLAAAAIIVTLPVLLLTIVIQKEILTGMTAGGVKGG